MAELGEATRCAGGDFSILKQFLTPSSKIAVNILNNWPISMSPCVYCKYYCLNSKKGNAFVNECCKIKKEVFSKVFSE